MASLTEGEDPLGGFHGAEAELNIIKAAAVVEGSSNIPSAVRQDMKKCDYAKSIIKQMPVDCSPVVTALWDDFLDKLKVEFCRPPDRDEF